MDIVDVPHHEAFAIWRQWMSEGSAAKDGEHNCTKMQTAQTLHGMNLTRFARIISIWYIFILRWDLCKRIDNIMAKSWLDIILTEKLSYPLRVPLSRRAREHSFAGHFVHEILQEDFVRIPSECFGSCGPSDRSPCGWKLLFNHFWDRLHYIPPRILALKRGAMIFGAID
jgi:hypothetical protein